MISLSDKQMQTVMLAAAGVPVEKRDIFLQLALNGMTHQPAA